MPHSIGRLSTSAPSHHDLFSAVFTPILPILSFRQQHRLPLRHLDPAGRVLLDAGARPAGARPIVLRAGDPREPRSRPAGAGAIDLQPQDQTSDPGAVPHLSMANS